MMLRSFLVLFSTSMVLCVEYPDADYGYGTDEILPRQDDTECGPNEDYSCVNSCPPEKTCQDREDYACLDDVEICSYKCVCKEGFYRNATGECITEEQCNECLGANEYYDCGNPCDNVCASLNLQNKTSCPREYLEGECRPSCYCEDGYARDESGNCIPIEKCPCGPNEEFSCVVSCPPEKVCGEYEQPSCPDVVEHCAHKCVCKEGFIRNTDGKCIPKIQCGKCQGANEYGTCGWPCDNVCATLHFQNKTTCLEETKAYDCLFRCYCDDGYARDRSGNCIPINKCHKCLGDNEHYECGGPCDNICSVLHLQNKTNCLQDYVECQPSCYCDDGYARDTSGTCVPIEKCPLRSCGNHEVLKDCKKKPCPPRVTVIEIIFSKCDDTRPCEPECECESDYVRKDLNVPDSPCIHKTKINGFRKYAAEQ